MCHNGTSFICLFAYFKIRLSPRMELSGGRCCDQDTFSSASQVREEGEEHKCHIPCTDATCQQKQSGREAPKSAEAWGTAVKELLHHLLSKKSWRRLSAPNPHAAEAVKMVLAAALGRQAQGQDDGTEASPQDVSGGDGDCIRDLGQRRGCLCRASGGCAHGATLNESHYTSPHRQELSLQPAAST